MGHARDIEPTPTVRGTTKPVALAYARRLLDRGRLSEPDPHCRGCGHRALDHGLDGLPAAERRRWFRPERIACRWRSELDATAPPCACSQWRPSTFQRTAVDGVGVAQVVEAWIEIPVGDWIVAYRLVNDRGTPVVGELRLFPAEGARPGPGQWSGELLGPEARVPRGGITARVLRRIRVRAYLRVMTEVVRRLRAAAPKLAQRLGWATPAEPAAEARPGSRRGRKGRPPEFYAAIARDYVAAVARGSWRPVVDVATRRRLRVTTVRDMIRRARSLGLLTLNGPGLRGGALTPRADALLRRPRRRRGRTRRRRGRAR